MTTPDTTARDPDALDGYVPPPYMPPATLDERLLKAWREITRTPGRAALAVLDVCAIAGFAVSLRPIPVSTADAGGPLHAQCGISFSIAGASNRAVDTACRYAFASRIPTLLLLGLLAVGVTALLVRVIARPSPRLWHAVTKTPARAGLATFEFAAFVALLAAAQPIAVTTADSAGPLRAQCGLQYFVLGAGNSAIRASCRHAYGPRGSVFFIVLVVLAVGAVVLVKMLRTPGSTHADDLVDATRPTG